MHKNVISEKNSSAIHFLLRSRQSSCFAAGATDLLRAPTNSKYRYPCRQRRGEQH